MCVFACVLPVGSRVEDNFAALAGGSARPLSEESRWTHRSRPGLSVPTRTDALSPLPSCSTLSSAIFGGVDINICERVSPWKHRGNFETGRQFLFRSHQELVISLKRRLNLLIFGFDKQFVCLQPVEGSKHFQKSYTVIKQLKHEILNHLLRSKGFKCKRMIKSWFYVGASASQASEWRQQISSDWSLWLLLRLSRASSFILITWEKSTGSVETGILIGADLMRPH